MNNFVLMVRIASNPELRYVQDSQRPIAQMFVEFEAGGNNNQKSSLKAVAWGNLGEKIIQQKYTQGDQVILVGRLSMNIFERQDGLKEKRAEMLISRIIPINHNQTDYSPPTENSLNVDDKVVEFPHQNQNNQLNSNDNSPLTDYDNNYNSTEINTMNSETQEKNLDDIPF